jgi:hypothetical protein
MRRDQQIRINELLLQREELFLRIHAAETEVSRLLGAPWPFVRPALPSDRRARRKPGAPAAAVSAPSAAPAFPAAPRRLEPGETAYRVTYRQFAQILTETHYDPAALATLLACRTDNLQVLRLETLDTAGAPSAVLWAQFTVPAA